MKKIISLTIVLFVFESIFYAQKPPVKFGSIDKADLEMQYYELDSSAQAVILCDYGYFSSTDFSFRRILRIKILKKEGLSWADRIFPGYSKSSIRGITYNLEGDQIIEEKLKPSSIFKERITEDIYRLRIVMPSVKVGSIIDIEFNMDFIPQRWYFQQTIPVKWSELIIEKGSYIDFRKNFFGYEPLFITTDSRWASKDMPAFKSEPYMNSIENYVTKIEFDILSIFIPGRIYKNYTTSWDAVNKYLLEHDYFGIALKASAYLNTIAKNIEEKYSSDEEKIKAAFDTVKILKWNEYESIYTSTLNLNYLFKQEVGNSADINLILTQLLKKLNFAASPVVLSTRENGVLSPALPSIDKLNYVISCVKLNDKTLLLDATDKIIPYYLLPERAINWQGRLVSETNSDWIPLKTDFKDKEKIFYNLTLNEDNNLEGTLNNYRSDYAAYNFRKERNTFNSQSEFIEDFQNNKTGLSVINSTITNLDSIYLPIIDKYEIIIKNFVDNIDDEIYIQPMLYGQMKDNPFKPKIRQYPVDFIYLIEKHYIINIKIPDNYSVIKLPKSINLKSPDNGCSLFYSASETEKNIQIVCKLNINKALFLQSEYPSIKEFFAAIIEKHAEPVILKINSNE